MDRQERKILLSTAYRERINEAEQEQGITKTENFAAAFRYALDQGHIKFGMVDFEGWQDDCDCAGCRSQRIVFDYLWPNAGHGRTRHGAGGE